MWKCKNCGEITEGSIFATDGYCKKCKEVHLLERYDPLNFKEITIGRDSYNKLKAIANTIKQTPEQTCENIINEFQRFLKEGEDL